jgi:hypothetical protein
MTSITLSASEELKDKLKEFLWVNWSELAREEILKKLIFENYLKTRQLSDKAWEFCEKIDWHPVDELPLKDEFIKKMKKIRKGKFKRYDSVEQLFAEIKNRK